MIRTAKGKETRSLEEWRVLAGPKRDDQWCDDRSAKEAARAWLEVVSPALPSEIGQALSSHPAFGSIREWVAVPELRLPFDKLRGEPRNTDLLLEVQDSEGGLLIALEAKADEPFGETVAEALAAAVERRLTNPRSRGVTRVEQLAASILGPRQKGEASLLTLRYQLLTAVAGAVATALRKGDTRVVFLIHEFRTKKTLDHKHAANAQDLDQFVNRISHGAIPKIEADYIFGPIAIPGLPLFERNPPLFIGKATKDLRTRVSNTR